MIELNKNRNTIEGYRMTFKFNASHSMTDRSKEHAHTFLVNLYITKDVSSFVEFHEYEKTITNYIEQYKGQYLNDLFEERPTLEFLCIRFFTDIEKILDSIDAFTLLNLELGDSPIRTVKVGRNIIAGRANIFITDEMFDLCEKGLGIDYERV